MTVAADVFVERAREDAAPIVVVRGMPARAAAPPNLAGAAGALGLTHLYDTRSLTAATQTLPNLVGVDAMQLGSAAGVDVNDPTRVVWEAPNLLWFPGTPSNYLSVLAASIPEMRGTTSAVIRAAFRFAANGVNSGIAGSCETSGGGLFSASTHQTGRLSYAMSDGTFAQVSLGTAGDLVEGGWYAAEWAADLVAVTVTGSFKACNTAAEARAAARSGPDGTWTVLAPVAAARPAFNSAVAHTNNLYIGTRTTTSDNQLGPVVFAQWRTDDAAIATFDAADIRSTDVATVNSRGITWSVNRSAPSHTVTATRSLLQFDGTNDYAQFPASATPDFTDTTGTYTALVCYRTATNHSSSKILWDARSALGAGATLLITAAGTVVAGVNNAATSTGTSTAMSSGAIRVAAVVVNNGTVAVFDANGLGSPVSIPAGAITHAAPRLGSLAYAVSLIPTISVFAVASGRVALTGPQVSALAADMIAAAAS